MEKFMRNNRGFTLIEVLIALAILSIALTAIIKTTSQHIRDTTYLQNKITANWVGTQVMNEIRAGVLKVSDSSDGISQQTEMLGKTWIWKAKFISTPNPHIKEINVDVYQKPEKNRLINLVSYLYVA
jgi:general secretion pathway protein I